MGNHHRRSRRRTNADWRQTTVVAGVLVTLIRLPMPLTMPYAITRETWRSRSVQPTLRSAPLQARIVEKARWPEPHRRLTVGIQSGECTGREPWGIVPTAGYSYRVLPLVAVLVAAVVIVLHAGSQAGFDSGSAIPDYGARNHWRADFPFAKTTSERSGRSCLAENHGEILPRIAQEMRNVMLA